MKKIFLLKPKFLNEGDWLLSTYFTQILVIAYSEDQARNLAAETFWRYIDGDTRGIENRSPWNQISLVKCTQIAEASIDLQDSIFTIFQG